MSVTRLPSKRWRAQIYDATQKKNVSAAKILGHSAGSYATKKEAVAARAEARKRICTFGSAMTVKEWWTVWTTDPLYARPKASTNLHNRERTKAFADLHGTLPLSAVRDEVVARWLAGGNRNSTVQSLRAMFADAASAKAGRLIVSNPFAQLGIRRSKGNSETDPPSEEMVWTLIAHARALCGPSFAAWLQVAAFTGMRPGELDALRWTSVDFATGLIRVSEQFSSRSRTFTSPKNGKTRHAPLTPPAREALVALQRDGEFCFTTLRGTHYSGSVRAYGWKAVRAAAGYTDTLYVATRHFAAGYMTNVLGLAAEDVAIALGHEDGGELVRQTYGHRDKGLSLARVQAAYESVGNVKPLRVVREDTG